MVKTKKEPQSQTQVPKARPEVQKPPASKGAIEQEKTIENARNFKELYDILMNQGNKRDAGLIIDHLTEFYNDIGFEVENKDIDSLNEYLAGFELHVEDSEAFESFINLKHQL